MASDDSKRPRICIATTMGGYDHATVLDRPKAEWAPNLERACAELTWETQAPNLLAAATGSPAPAAVPTPAADEGVNGAWPRPRRQPKTVIDANS